MPTAEQVFLEELDKEMNNIIDRTFELSQGNLVDENKIDTGTLFKTGNINRAFLEKEIVYPAPYAEYVEFGRMPGQMPPPDALIKWVQRKLGVTNEAEAKRVSFAIAQAIKKRGIEPTPFLREAFAKVKTEMKLWI